MNVHDTFARLRTRIVHIRLELSVLRNLKQKREQPETPRPLSSFGDENVFAACGEHEPSNPPPALRRNEVHLSCLSDLSNHVPTSVYLDVQRTAWPTARRSTSRIQTWVRMHVSRKMPNMQMQEATRTDASSPWLRTNANTKEAAPAS